MNYPVWQLGFPGGLLIAAVAVLHVFISHFAVGGGAYLVLTERRAYSHNDSELLAYVRHHSKFFALLTVVLKDAKLALLVLVSTAFSFVGGVAAVMLMGGAVSLGSLAGFVALFGLSTRTAVLMVTRPWLSTS